MPCNNRNAKLYLPVGTKKIFFPKNRRFILLCCCHHNSLSQIIVSLLGENDARQNV